MAFEDALFTLRDDELGQLRCKKALRRADPSQLVDLRGNSQFQTPSIVGALTQFALEPRVFHRDHRLWCPHFDEPFRRMDDH
jgi:hypothetical protein